jgi:ubiquinone/menaquinone biosynthesis C-methylase UbiE
VNGRAEATTLEDNSVDAIVCATAFHWFDREKAKKEWIRILKKSSSPNVALIWNERNEKESPFLTGYEDILKMCSSEYEKVNHR